MCCDDNVPMSTHRLLCQTDAIMYRIVQCVCTINDANVTIACTQENAPPALWLPGLPLYRIIEWMIGQMTSNVDDAVLGPPSVCDGAMAAHDIVGALYTSCHLFHIIYTITNVRSKTHTCLTAHQAVHLRWSPAQVKQISRSMRHQAPNHLNLHRPMHRGRGYEVASISC